MHALQALPEGYRAFETVNLQTDKKTAALVNGAALGVSVVLAVIGHGFVPIRSFFSMEQGLGVYFLRLFVMLFGMIAYMVLHELTHAAAMKAYGAGALRFGYTGLYAYAGSEGDYFDKRSYRVIALAPLVVWTLLLTIPLILVPASWFWVVYLIQISNIAGAAGDLYVTFRFAPLPEDILVRDTGLDMTVYQKS